MAYPNEVYPADPDFPTPHDGMCPGETLYNVISGYIEDIAAAMSLVFDSDGNVVLAADKGIYWNSILKISESAGQLYLNPWECTARLYIDTPTIAALTVTGNMETTTDTVLYDALTVAGTVTCGYVKRYKHILNQIDEPADPAENQCVIWYSTGVGYGNAKDLCVKITEGAVTKSFVLKAWVEP